jgi:hypothetical protein
MQPAEIARLKLARQTISIDGTEDYSIYQGTLTTAIF